MQSSSPVSDFEWIKNISYNPFVQLILILICLFSLILNYYLQKKLIYKIEMLNKDLIKKNKKINNLQHFLPLKTYEIYSIDETTSVNTIEELITVAKRTYVVTLFPYDDNKLNIHYLQIELIQNQKSIIINVEFFFGHNLLLPQLEEFLSVIFHPSKLIQVWGNINRFRYDINFNLIYSQHDIRNCNFVDIQNDFEIWYNNTFQHNHQNSDQELDFHHTTDTSAQCLCSYHSLTSSTNKNQWSLKNAIEYTFQENFNYSNLHPYQCLAITKLAIIIFEKWDYTKIQDYIKNKSYETKK